jgi:DNA transposition AAA+ family ATPase
MDQQPFIPTDFHKRVMAAVASATRAKTGSMSQLTLSKLANVNTAYVSKLSNGEHIYTNNKPIPEKVYRNLAKALKLEGDVLETVPFLEIYNYLALARESHHCGVIDGDAGLGKTQAIAAFKRDFPRNTYVLKCSRDMNAVQTVRALCEACGLVPPPTGNRSDMRRKLAAKLAKDDRAIVILDEAENLCRGQFVYDTLKALYDELEDVVSIVLVGANHYYDYLKKKADKVDATNALPQFFSRFKTNPLVFEDVRVLLRKDIGMVLDHFGVSDPVERKKFTVESDSYRDLFKALRKRDSDAKVLGGEEGQDAA